MLFGGIEIPGRPSPENIRRLDLLPLPQIARMMQTGICIDREHLWSLSSTLELRKTSLGRAIQSFVPQAALDEFVSDSPEDSLNVESAEQISNLLFQTLQIGSSEKLKMTKSGKRISSGKKQLETLKRRHPVIPLILEYREASKLNSMIGTVVNKAIREGDNWVIHTDIVTTRTDTGRLASRKPNLQNIGSRSELGREFRAGFIARPGKVLISADYSQIELRLLAHAANEPNMLAVFQAGGDIHVATAMRAFSIDDESKVDKLLHRAPSKNLNFAVGYSISPPGLYDLMALTYATAGKEMPDWLTLEWCADFISKWFDLYPKAKDYFDLQHYRARRYGIVWTSFGRVRRIPEVRSYHDRIVQAGLRQAGNMPIQGLAADVMKIGMARVERLLMAWRAAGIYVEALLPIHDELLVECDPEWAEDIKDLIIIEMEQALVDQGRLMCRCPIVADGKLMAVWMK